MLGLADLGGVVANSTSLTLASVAIALITILVWSQQKPGKDFPPGPRGWPVIGNLLEFQSERAPHSIFLEYAKKYGDIFSIKVGQRWTVVLNGAAVIKEALLKKGVEFADRPIYHSSDLFSKDAQDILFGQFSPRWKLHRKLAFTAFRNLATGNNELLEELINSVVPGLTKHLESMGSEPFKPRPAVASTIINILATICFGKRYEFDSPDLQYWLMYNEEILAVLGNGIASDYFPILRHIPTPGIKRVKRFIDEFHGAIKKEVDEHRTNFDGAFTVGEPKDLIEMLFQARQEMEDEGNNDMTMITETHIILTVANVFDAAIDTSILSLLWCIGLMVQYPDVQAKVAAEVDKVVGRDRLPCLNDRDKLPYTTATLYEVMRYSSIVPVALPHATTKSVQIGGYTLPKGTWVLVNLYSMHFDEKLWDKPDEFKPEHFLDETGEARLHPEGFLPFSTGRRVCLGESLAKAELFLLFSWLFQHFKFAKAPGMEETDYSESVAVLVGNMVIEHDVVVEKRF